MLRVRSTELLHFILSHSVDLISIQESSLNLYFSFWIPGFSALRSDCTHSQPGIFSPDDTHVSGGVIIFVRQGLFFSELSTPSVSSLDLYFDYAAVNISLNNSSSLSFFNDAPPIRSSPADSRTGFFPASIPPFSRNLFILGNFNCHHPLWDSKDTYDLWEEEVLDWVISSDLLPLNDTDIFTLLHRSSGSRSFPDISFTLSSLVLSCSCELLQDLDSDHLPTLLTVHLSLVFFPNERPPSFNFQKTRWDGFAYYFDAHCPFTESYSSFSLSPAAALLTFLTLIAAKSSIPFGRIKRQSQAWWSAEVEEAVSKRRKAFASVYRSDEYRQAYISAFQHASSTIGKARTWQAACSSLCPKSNPKSVCSFFVLSLAILPPLPPLLNFPLVPLPGNRLRSLPTTWDLTFLSPSQKLCVAEPEATFSSSVEPRALRSLIPLSSPLFPRRIFAAATNISSSTATGSDKVAYLLLKHLPLFGMGFLLHIFKLSFILVNIFYYSHPLGKPLDSPTSFRPISLTSCVPKLSERIILSRLLFILESNFILSSLQADLLLIKFFIFLSPFRMGSKWQ